MVEDGGREGEGSVRGVGRILMRKGRVGDERGLDE